MNSKQNQNTRWSSKKYLVDNNKVLFCDCFHHLQFSWCQFFSRIIYSTFCSFYSLSYTFSHFPENAVCWKNSTVFFFSCSHVLTLLYSTLFSNFLLLILSLCVSVCFHLCTMIHETIFIFSSALKSRSIFMTVSLWLLQGEFRVLNQFSYIVPVHNTSSQITFLKSNFNSIMHKF